MSPRPLARRRMPAGLIGVAIAAVVALPAFSDEVAQTRVYDNRLTEIAEPAPILADYPEYCEPVRESKRFQAAPLVLDEQPTLGVRAWRFSYNARGIIEMDNQIAGNATAIIVVHPWGIDDGQGWDSPQPAGVAFNCTPEKNRMYHEHVERVLNPLLERLRPHVKIVAYSLPGGEDDIRRKLYRSFRATPTAQQRAEGRQELTAKLADFEYRGNPLDAQLMLDREPTMADYFRKFPGLDSSAKFNAEGFWDLPIPVVRQINVAPDDVVIYDAEGYPPLRDFLKSQGIRHVLLMGYATDMCYCRTTAGYENLDPDFNVFLVGDATVATFPANNTPRYATNAALSFASLEHLVTQGSWIETIDASVAQSE